MAKKPLKNILAGVKASKLTPGSTGNNPGVDYRPKAGDEEEFVAKHVTQKHADRAGNGDDIYQATNIKHSLLKSPEEDKHRPMKGVYEEEINEGGGGLRDLSKAGRTYNVTKQAQISRERSAKAYREPGMPSKEDLRSTGIKAFKDFVSKGGKVTTKEEAEGVEENHMGFNKLQSSVAHKKDIKNSGAVNHKKLKETNDTDYPCDTRVPDDKKKDGKKLLLGDKKKVYEAVGGLTRDEIEKRKKAGYRKAADVLGDPDRSVNLPKVNKNFTNINKMTNSGKKIKEDIEQIDEFADKLKKAAKIGSVVGALGAHAGKVVDTTNVISQDNPAHAVTTAMTYANPTSRALNALPTIFKADKAGKGENEFARQKKYASKSVKEQRVDEVLTKKDSAGKWIRDFVHSDNPKFKGKSPAKRKQQALAAYYAKKREANEELAMPMLEDGKKKKKDKKCAPAKEQTDTPLTFPSMSVDVNTGRNV